MRPPPTACGLICVCALLWLACPARAQIVVFESNAGAAGQSVVETLRIQLSGSTTALRQLPLPQREPPAARGKALVDAGTCELVVWVEHPAPRRYVLHYVGRRAGRAVWEHARLNGRAGPSLERAMALKVREVLDEFVRIERAPPTTPVSAAPATPTPPTPTTAAAPTASAPPVTSSPGRRGRLALLLELTAAGSSPGGNAGPQLQLGGSLGLAHDALGGRAEAWLGARWASALSHRSELGAVRATEWAPRLGLRLGWPWRSIRVGARVDLSLRVLHATGTRTDGERGSRSAVSPALALGPELALPLSRHWQLRWAPGIELALRAQRFAIDEQAVLDLGRVRAFAELSAIYMP